MADLIAEVAARGGQPSEHAVAVRSMFDRISPTYDLLNRVMSAGIDRRWRARALTVLSEGLPDGPLLDSCAGTLDLAQAMEARFSGRRVVAADFSREMLRKGQDKVRAVPLAVGDAMRLPFASSAFAGMTCAFGIRNLSNPEQGLREALRVLKPGGALVVLEFFRPSTFLMRLFHGTFARFMLPTLGFLISRDREAYGYLARSMQGFYSRQEFEQLGLKAGFSRVESEDLSFGIASLIRWVK
ncbi:MAG TPA: ubiquinone/menaquinone biosynthesis methyltransferase [Polyangiales bacterium]